ncbi:MAG: hypothetical protein JWP29_3164 [Rhodoferax sp.]|nr:hypothetical protein [Rhodoferax sp.]
MAKEVTITLSLPARSYARLQRRASSAGLSVERAILQCVERHAVFADAPEAHLDVATRPGQLWADEWSSRWGELSFPHGPVQPGVAKP